MKKLFSLVGVIAILATLSLAQESTGEIVGKVTFAEDGSPVPGVTVTLTGETHGRSTYITTREGNYRFWKLNPGNFTVRFELQGFKTVERSGIRVSVGQSLSLDVALEAGAIEEEITVIGQANMIDTRKAQVGANYTKEVIQSLPIAMRTTEIINLAPGIMPAFPQIAGQGSGTLHGFGVQNVRADYALDGASFRDTYGHGGMPTGVATARLEEAQVTTTGQDITNVMGGPSINFVSKRGGNKLSGDSYIALMDRSMEDPEKLPDYQKSLGNLINSGLYQVYDYGASLGGPIFKDHLWFFGSWSVVSSASHDMKDKPNPASYNPDLYGKINAQWKTATAEVSFAHTDSRSVNNPFSATILNSYYNYDRVNPADTFTAQATVTLWQKLLLSAKFTHFDLLADAHQNNIIYTGTGAGTTYEEGRTLNPVGQFYTDNYFKSPPYNTEKTGHWQTYEQHKWRPYVVIEGNYFAEGLLGGNHEFKFGFDRNYARYNALYLLPNQTRVLIYPATMVGGTKDPLNAPSKGPGANYWGRIFTTVDWNGEKRSERTGIYVQDIMNYGRLTLNLGLRFDWHAWAWGVAHYNGWSPFDIPITELDQWVGPMDCPAGEFKLDPTFSPRLSLTYDVRGTGKDLIKFMFANYQGALDNLAFRPAFKSGNFRGIVYYPFIDYNGNYVPDWPTAKTPGVKNEFFLNDMLGHWPKPQEILDMIAFSQAEQKVLEAKYGAGNVPWDAWTYPGWFLLAYSGNVLGRLNPAVQKATDFLADDFSPEKVLEMSLGYEKQVTQDISLQVLAAYKKEYNFTWARGYYGTPDNYTLAPIDTVKGTGVDPVTGWQIFGTDTGVKTPNGYVLTTYKHYYNYFKGLQFIFNKRLSHGWLLQASLDLQDWRRHYPETAIPMTVTEPSSTYKGEINPEGEFSRQTLYDYYHKAYTGVFEYGSTEPMGQNCRWHFKVSGLVRLPWSLNLSGFIDAREGYIYAQYVSSYLGATLPKKGTKFGDTRMPNFWYANATLDRTFKFSENVSAKLFITGYNLFNKVTAQEYHRTLVPTSTDAVIQINRSRIFQVGVRFSFR